MAPKPTKRIVEQYRKIRLKIAFIWSFIQASDIEQIGKSVTGLQANTRGQSMINRGVNMAVGVLVVGLLTAYLLPIAIDELVAVDTSSWGNAEKELFGLLPLFFVLAIVLFVVAKAMDARS